jgi:SPP1 gp7 family putative phage head morphogenesis protein
MCNIGIGVTEYTEKLRKNYDPTHTTVLRNTFAKDISRRFSELVRVIKESVYKNDAFGLSQKDFTTMQMYPAYTGQFAFARSADKLNAFMKWLEDQVNKGIITITELEQLGIGVESFWTNKYITDSYKRGIIRARYEMIRSGYQIPSIEETGGIGAVFNTPFHLDRVGLLFTRVFNELKGITDAMDMIISRILSQGLADGDGPALLARKLVSAINGKELELVDSLGRFIPAERRATILARTEIIRAHHAATIQEYRNWAVAGVTVKGEWRTAGDDRVCSLCEAMEGKIFTLDEIEPLIPLHPQCRCIALPYSEWLEKALKEIGGN